MEELYKKSREWILEHQRRCIVCGKASPLHVHHRVFRGEGEIAVRENIEKNREKYEELYERKLGGWGLHDIQNLAVLCWECHEAHGKGVHGGNRRLELALKASFTCPITGFNVFFQRR